MLKDNQWLFPVEALYHYPSREPLHKTLYDLSRGVEFLFRLGTSLKLPHAELVDLFVAIPDDRVVQDYAWTFAHDSFRTPLCILYPPRVIAAACFVLAQYMAEGPNSLPLDARISFSAPSASLPTPPSHKAPSPDASRLAIEFFTLSEKDVQSVAGIYYILASTQT
ncbi:hypothetical protein HHX47_DHR1000697 [Lentinula edodes]|nr:hypothetical protein HHX47_DHR1000697 [Lentinula edodes]